MTASKNISDILTARRRPAGTQRQFDQIEQKIIMPRFVTILSAGLIATAFASVNPFMPVAAAATMSDADKAALKQATDACKAQVKEQAQFHEMSWYAKHKAVKNCIKETLAHH